MDKAARRYARYLAAMASVQSIFLSNFQALRAFSQKRVEEDLDHMIGQGYFGPTAYLDLSLGYFSAAVRLRRKQRPGSARRPLRRKEAEEGYAGVLRSIRRGQ